MYTYEYYNVNVYVRGGKTYIFKLMKHSMMPVLLSNDLWWRIVWRHLFLMESAKDVARSMFVSIGSVYHFTECYLAAGDVRPFTKKNGPSIDLCEHEELLLVLLVLARPGIYLSELQEELYSCTMHWVMYQRYADHYIAMV